MASSRDWEICIPRTWTLPKVPRSKDLRLKSGSVFLNAMGEQATGARFVEKSEEQEQATSQMSGFIHEMKLRESTQKGNQEIVDNCTSRSNEVFGNVGGCMDVAGTESGQLQGRRSSRGALCPSNPATCLSFSLPFIVVT